MPGVRDKERTLIEKIKKLQGQLSTEYRRVSAFVFQCDTGIEIQGTTAVVEYLKNLENQENKLSSICEEAGLREALSLVQGQQDQDHHLDHERLVVPLSMANYDEVRKWLVDDLKAETKKRGFASTGKNTIYAYDKKSKTSTDEHEKRRPAQWPEDCIAWRDITYGITQLGACFATVSKSEVCPQKPLDFFRLFITRRLLAADINPEDYYTESKTSEKRIRLKSRIAHSQARSNPQAEINQDDQNVQSFRPTPEELADNRSDNANSTNSSIHSNSRSNNNSDSERNSSMDLSTGSENLICHICKCDIPEEDDPILCDCATEDGNVYVHWACVCKGCPLVQDQSPEHIGLCHLCKDYVSVENMQNGNILLCNCATDDDTFVHYECLQNHGCDK